MPLRRLGICIGEAVFLASYYQDAQLTPGRTILYAPFTPFIVLFCHVIETSNADDLRRLDRFTVGLQPVVSMSQGIEKLHRLCNVLYHVAALYVEAKAQQQQDQGMSMVGNDFDMYLSQLGFISQQHSSDSTAAGGEFGLGGVPAVNQARLGDWFSGNRYVMGLMEEDMLDFTPGVWSSTMGG